MSIWNPIPYLNQILYGSFQNHDDFDLKLAFAPMTDDQVNNQRSDLPKSTVSDLGRRVEVGPESSQKVDRFFSVRRIEQAQFKEVKDYWQRVESRSPLAAAGFIFTAIGGMGVCFSSSSRLLAVAGFAVAVATLVFAGKCMSDNRISHASNDVLKGLDRGNFQNFAEYFALRRLKLYPQKFSQIMANRTLRLDVDSRRGILHPMEVQSFFKSALSLLSGKLNIEYHTPKSRHRWVIMFVNGVGKLFNEEVVKDVFREEDKTQSTLLEICKKFRELRDYIQESENKLEQTRGPFRQHWQQLHETLGLSSFRDEYIQKGVTLKLVQEMQKLNQSDPNFEESRNNLINQARAKQKEIHYYHDIALESIRAELLGASYQPYLQASYYLADYYEECRKFCVFAWALYYNRTPAAYTLDKKEVQFVSPPFPPPDIKVTPPVIGNLKRALVHSRLLKGTEAEYLKFLDAYAAHIQPKP